MNDDYRNFQDDNHAMATGLVKGVLLKGPMKNVTSVMVDGNYTPLITFEWGGMTYTVAVTAVEVTP